MTSDGLVKGGEGDGRWVRAGFLVTRSSQAFGIPWAAASSVTVSASAASR